MTGYIDAVTIVCALLSDDEIIGYILGSLGLEYDPLIASLIIFDGKVTLIVFYAYLLSFKARQEQHAANGGDFSSSANNAMRQGSGLGPHDNNCNFCADIGNRNNDYSGGHGGRSDGNND